MVVGTHFDIYKDKEQAGRKFLQIYLINLQQISWGVRNGFM